MPSTDTSSQPLSWQVLHSNPSIDFSRVSLILTLQYPYMLGEQKANCKQKVFPAANLSAEPLHDCQESGLTGRQRNDEAKVTSALALNNPFLTIA